MNCIGRVFDFGLKITVVKTRFSVWRSIKIKKAAPSDSLFENHVYVRLVSSAKEVATDTNSDIAIFHLKV
jgi:hypothetical protein